MVFGALLYAPGAFFFFPWKPPVQLLVGDSYATAYRHFRRDHSDPTNLLLHLVALTWQLGGNFGLLAALDGALFDVTLARHRPLATLTALAWGVTLLASPAPLLVSAASIAAIGAAYWAAPSLSADALELGAMVLFLAVLCASTLLCTPSVTVGGARRSSLARLGGSLARALAYFGLACGARWAARPWQGAHAASSAQLNAALALLMGLLAFLPKPVVPCVFGGVLVARPLADLTGQEVLLFYGQAFLAQLSQGVAHDVSKQKATLLSHEASTADRKVRISA